MSPLLIGMTLTLLVACQSQTAVPNFRQPTASGSVLTGATVGVNEMTPHTTDSLEVEAVEKTAAIEIHASSGSLIMGDLGAPLTLTIYDDYGCFYCREFGSTDLPWLLKTYVAQKKLNIERVFAPQSAAGILMAKVALCSVQQNQFEAVDKALHASAIATDPQVAALAKTLKINLKTLQTCMASAWVETSLQATLDRTNGSKVTRFPSFELQNDHWTGVENREVLQKKIENAF